MEVRRQLASSISEVIRLLKTDVLKVQYEEQLVKIVKNYCGDLEEVKYCALKSLPAFLSEVSFEAREKLLPFLRDLFKPGDSWHVRKAKCGLIGAMGKHYSPDKLMSQMINFLWEGMLEDEVGLP